MSKVVFSNGDGALQCVLEGKVHADRENCPYLEGLAIQCETMICLLCLAVGIRHDCVCRDVVCIDVRIVCRIDEMEVPIIIGFKIKTSRNPGWGLSVRDGDGDVGGSYDLVGVF